MRCLYDVKVNRLWSSLRVFVCAYICVLGIGVFIIIVYLLFIIISDARFSFFTTVCLPLGYERKNHERSFLIIILHCVWCLCVRGKAKPMFLSRYFFFFAFSRRPWRMFRLANRQRSLFTHAHTLVARASPYTYKHILRSRDTTRAREGKKQTSFLEHYRRRFPIILVSHTARIRVVAACPIWMRFLRIPPAVLSPPLFLRHVSFKKGWDWKTWKGGR